MQAKTFPEVNTRLAEGQDEYQTLPVFSGFLEIDGQQYPAMQSKWEPTQEELERLQSGAYVSLIILGQSHPPVMLTVDETPIKN